MRTLSNQQHRERSYRKQDMAMGKTRTNTSEGRGRNTQYPCPLGHVINYKFPIPVVRMGQDYKPCSIRNKAFSLPCFASSHCCSKTAETGSKTPPSYTSGGRKGHSSGSRARYRQTCRCR